MRWPGRMDELGEDKHEGEGISTGQGRVVDDGRRGWTEARRRGAACVATVASVPASLAPQ